MHPAAATPIATASQSAVYAKPSFHSLGGLSHQSPLREYPMISCVTIASASGNAQKAMVSGHLTYGQRTETVKVRGALSTNDGEIAVNWALDGHG
jgi:hypothetical protein